MPSLLRKMTGKSAKGLTLKNRNSSHGPEPLGVDVIDRGGEIDKNETVPSEINKGADQEPMRRLMRSSEIGQGNTPPSSDETKGEVGSDSSDILMDRSYLTALPPDLCGKEGDLEYHLTREDTEGPIDILKEAAEDAALRRLSTKDLHERRVELEKRMEAIIEKRERIQRDMEEYERGITRRMGQPIEGSVPTATTRGWIAKIFGDFSCSTACG